MIKMLRSSSAKSLSRAVPADRKIQSRPHPEEKLIGRNPGKVV